MKSVGGVFRTVSGVGVNDVYKCDSKIYLAWRNMIDRCYNKKHKFYKDYGEKGVKVACEWKKLSNFKSWFEQNYIEGYQLDKDFGGGKLYSPETCVFVSKSDNVKEMLSRQTYERMKGEKNINSYSKNYYETNATFRSIFKRTCRRRGWDFNDFEERESCFHVNKNGRRSRKYTYTEIVNKG